MLNMNDVVRRAALRAHELICPDPSACAGPTDQELMVASAILAAALPQIFAHVQHDAVVVSTAMTQGKFDPGPPDATEPGAEKLLRQWFHWWRLSPLTLSGPELPEPPKVQTLAYLTAVAVEQGRVVRSPADV